MTNGQSPSKTSPQKPQSNTKPATQPATSGTSKPADSNSNEKSNPILLSINPEIVQFVSTPDYQNGLVVHIFTKQSMKELHIGEPEAIYRVTNVLMTLEKLDPIPAPQSVNTDHSPTPPPPTTHQA